MTPSETTTDTGSETKGRRSPGAADAAGGLPAPVPSMVRVVKHGYRAEPRLLWASLAMTTLEALPDVLVGIWLALVTDGLVHHHETRVYVGAAGLAASATLMWALSVTLDRTTRRLGDRLNIMFQGHVARLQAEVATVEHHERPAYLDRIAVLRTGVFALDHLFRSMFTMVGWLLRLGFVCLLLAAIHPALLLLPLAALPLLAVAAWRPKVEKRTEERVAPHRLPPHAVTVLHIYGHLFYAGARTLEDKLPSPRGARNAVVVMRMRGRSNLGATLIDVLASYAKELQKGNGRLYLAGINPAVRDEIVRTAKLDLSGPVQLYEMTPLVGEATRKAVADAKAWLASQR